MEADLHPHDARRAQRAAHHRQQRPWEPAQAPPPRQGHRPCGREPRRGPYRPAPRATLWYQDNTGTKLELCLESSTLCLTTLLDPTSPPLVDDAEINFVNEAFYWAAEAEIARGIGGKVLLVLALEAAFANADEEIRVGDQIVFGRVRIRVDELLPGSTYTVTHPFGTKTLVADEDGEIDFTEDLGCGASPCDFSLALNSRITRFLRWDPAFAPAAPAGYLGNPSVDHRITGSPTGNNLFRVQGPNVGGAGVNSIQTNLFSLAGKLLP